FVLFAPARLIAAQAVEPRLTGSRRYCTWRELGRLRRCPRLVLREIGLPSRCVLLQPQRSVLDCDWKLEVPGRLQRKTDRGLPQVSNSDQDRNGDSVLRFQAATQPLMRCNLQELFVCRADSEQHRAGSRREEEKRYSEDHPALARLRGCCSALLQVLRLLMPGRRRPERFDPRS